MELAKTERGELTVTSATPRDRHPAAVYLARLSPGSRRAMRHAHASHNLDRGTPIHLVQATLGHSSVAVTGRYLHARPGDSSARYLAV